MQNRLKTKDRLQKFGLCADDKCAICGLQGEYVNHLMFACCYSSQCIEHVMRWLGVPWKARNVHQMCRWIRGRYTGSSFQKKVVLAALAATVYTIWRIRNTAYWEGVVMITSKAVQLIQSSVKGRVLQLLTDKVKDRDRLWIENV